MRKMIGKNLLPPSLFCFFLFFLLVEVSGAGAIQQNNSLQVTVSWEPEVPLPNATIKFTANCENVTMLKIQFCLNGLCGLPVEMQKQDNNTFEYVFVPGNGNPPTSDGDNLSFEILLGSDVLYSNWIIIRENAKPVIQNIWFEPEHPKLGENLTIYANVSDDYGVKNVECNISHENWFGTLELTEQGGNFSANFMPLYSGQHLITIFAIDNSNQITSKTSAVFVFPPEQTDNVSPQLVDAFSVRTNESTMTLKVYLTDNSGIAEAGVFINQTFYPLERTSQGFFTAEVPLSETVQIYARDPYNNTLNITHHLKVYSESNLPDQNQPSSVNGMVLGMTLFIGILAGVAIALFIKNLKGLNLLILFLLVFAIVLAAQQGLVEKSVDAGGNIYNGNTCWSCLALQPKSLTVSWLEIYPNGSVVNHPNWILDLLAEGKPLLIYVHQVPCTGCEIQWRDMVSHGIITQDGKISGKFEGKVLFKVLDVTMGSETRNQGMEVLRIYTLGSALGTPTTVCLVKTGDKVLWWSKAGVVYSQELNTVLDEAIHMSHR